MPNKLITLLQSRKFWALATSIVTVILGYSTGKLYITPAVLSIIGALSAYMLGTGMENGGTTRNATVINSNDLATLSTPGGISITTNNAAPSETTNSK